MSTAPPPTPRTDAAIERIRNARWFSGDVVSPEFARQLERELAATRTALEQAYVHNQNMHCFVTKGRLNESPRHPRSAATTRVHTAAVEFTIDDVNTFHSTVHQDIRAAANHYWDIALREWFEQHEGGMPSTEDLRKHGRWLIPQPDGLWIMAKHFQWRGQVILTGYLDTTDGMHKIQAPPSSSNPSASSPDPAASAQTPPAPASQTPAPLGPTTPPGPPSSGGPPPPAAAAGVGVV